MWLSLDGQAVLPIDRRKAHPRIAAVEDEVVVLHDHIPDDGEAIISCGEDTKAVVLCSLCGLVALRLRDQVI